MKLDSEYMTELLYLTDSYKKTLTARVVSVEKNGKLWNIVLNKTIFYPQGGGQPSDTGTIKGKHGSATVKHVRMQADNVIHESTLEGTLNEGDPVECAIDWERRFANMRVHSAGHIVHEAVMLVAPDLKPIKGDHGSHPFIEYEGFIPLDKKNEIENKSNAIVGQNKKQSTEFVTYEELVKRASYIPEHLPKNKPLRIATITGFDPIPDGGTQLATTGEVGEITITKIDNSEGHVTVGYSVATQTKNEPVLENNAIDATQFIGQLLQAQQDTIALIASAQAPIELVKLDALGPKSDFGQLSKQMKDIAREDKQRVGIVLNQVKLAIEDALAKHTPQTKNAASQIIDVTLPGHIPVMGHLHPTTIVIREMNQIFASMGFSIGDGPEIETDEYNYNRVNLPMDHPARDLQDSIYIEEPNWLLRTHTSSVESHLLEDVPPPFRFVIPGKVYRFENANATNNIMFYQYEGMAVGTDITLSDLKGTLDVFVRKFFGETRETRFRCKYYPQVEPGVGVDISCAFCNKKGCAICKGRGWIEMLGAGMVHPNMFRKAGLDPDTYTGFAWGMGLDRIVMQRYGITDIRSLYNGDIAYKE